MTASRNTAPALTDDFCDQCDALLTPAELAASPRWTRCLCDACAAETAAANPHLTERGSP